jgi:hypothetical protein
MPRSDMRGAGGCAVQFPGAHQTSAISAQTQFGSRASSELGRRCLEYPVHLLNATHLLWRLVTHTCSLLTVSLLLVWRSLTLTHAALVPFFKCQHIVLTEWNGMKFRGLSVGFDSFTAYFGCHPVSFCMATTFSKHIDSDAIQAEQPMVGASNRSKSVKSCDDTHQPYLT